MATMSSAASSSTTTMESDRKISNDLLVLTQKMDILDSMMNPTDASVPRISVKDATVRSLVGYLDACGPRMIQLVTACTSTDFGVLSEEVFGEVLGCNDRLQKILGDFDTRLLTETSATTTVASVAGGSSAETTTKTATGTAAAGADLTEQFGDLLLASEDLFAEAQGHGGIDETSPVKSPLAGAKTTGETSEDFADFFAEAPSDSNANSNAAAVDVDSSAYATTPGDSATDPFDDFLAERTDAQF